MLHSELKVGFNWEYAILFDAMQRNAMRSQCVTDEVQMVMIAVIRATGGSAMLRGGVRLMLLPRASELQHCSSSLTCASQVSANQLLIRTATGRWQRKTAAH